LKSERSYGILDIRSSFWMTLMCNDTEFNEVKHIKCALHGDGYFISEDFWSEDVFRNICTSIGEIIYEADVKLGAVKPRNYQQPQAIDFHTDHISAEIVAWQCVVADTNGGAMQLLDLNKVIQKLEVSDRKALGDVLIADNAAWKTTHSKVPMCQEKNGKWHFHYVPWLQTFTENAAAKIALRKFEQIFNEIRKIDFIEFDLEPGQVIFLDNHRIAHGRKALQASSQRYLKRLWLREHGG